MVLVLIRQGVSFDSTLLPNGLVLKMDGAQARGLHSVIVGTRAAMSRRTWRRGITKHFELE